MEKITLNLIKTGKRPERYQRTKNHKPLEPDEGTKCQVMISSEPSIKTNKKHDQNTDEIIIKKGGRVHIGIKNKENTKNKHKHQHDCKNKKEHS